MTYCGTSVSECIIIHNDGDPKAKHYIEMTKAANTSNFIVTCCCYDDWGYEFKITNPSDYERIKFNIMEAVFECENFDELLTCLSEIFEDGFADIIINGGNDMLDVPVEDNNKYLN